MPPGVRSSSVTDRRRWTSERRRMRPASPTGSCGPSSQTYARTRMRAWLLRQAAAGRDAALPANDDERRLARCMARILDTPPEERFDRYTESPHAAVRRADRAGHADRRDRQWFKSRHGFDVAETPATIAFCAHAILDDARVRGDRHSARRSLRRQPRRDRRPARPLLRGVPLAAADGSLVGTLCLIDRRARQLDDQQLGLLRDLADLVEAELVRPVDVPDRADVVPAA